MYKQGVQYTYNGFYLNTTNPSVHMDGYSNKFKCYQHVKYFISPTSAMEITASNISEWDGTASVFISLHDIWKEGRMAPNLISIINEIDRIFKEDIVGYTTYGIG